MSVSPDPQHHAPELVPTLRHLPHRHQHQRWLRRPVLCVLKVHQTEIKSRLVIYAQTPACWGETQADSSTARTSFLPTSQAASRAQGTRVNTDAPLRPAHSAAVAQAGHWMAVE